MMYLEHVVVARAKLAEFGCSREVLDKLVLCLTLAGMVFYEGA